MTHGISEHSECYSATAESLAKLGWNTIGWDMRGHGRSEGKRGFVANFSDYTSDLGALLRHLKKQGYLELPFAILGHSLGGLVTLRYALEHHENDPQPGAIALSSPALGISVAVPPAKDLAARFIKKIWPSMTMYNEINYNDLTRDPEFLNTYAKDSLRHDKISPALYLGMLDTMSMVVKSGEKIKTPVIIQAAGHEKIVSLEATKQFYESIGSENKKLVVYEDSYHEIFNDLDRDKVFRDLDQFLSSALGIKR